MGSATVDDLLANFGDAGTYQKCIFVMLMYALCTISLNDMMTIFNLGFSQHHCKVPIGISLNDSIPRLENGEFDSCSIYVNFSDRNAGVTDCQNGWTHYPKNGKWSIIQEWDLVCDKHYRAVLANSLYFFGVAVGCGLVGNVADKIGRRPVILTCLYTYVIIGIGIAFVQDYYSYVILRCLTGIVVQGIFGAAYTMGIELFLTHRRNIIVIITEIHWPLMFITLTTLDYFVKNWRIFHLIISIPFAFTITYIWFLPECPRWLIAMNKIDRAKNELKRFARYNKLAIPQNLESEITHVIDCNQENKNALRTYGFLDLIRTKRMFAVVFAACFFFFSNCFAFYAISYSMSSISSNVHISYVFTGITDVCVEIASYFILNKFTRKAMSYGTLIFIASMCILVVLLMVSLSPGNSVSLGITIISGLGRVGITAYFAVTVVYVTEMSPTVIRGLVLGMANLWARVGAIVAPQVMLLEKYVWKPLPFVISAFLNIISLFIVIQLPETKNKPLPQVPDDTEKLWEKSKKLSETEIMKPLN